MLGPGLMRWAGPMIAPPLFRDACLYLHFTSGVYADAPAGVLSRRRSFEELVTFTRSGTAERIDADLQFETILTGKPRFMHDPAGVLPRRLAVEATAQNLAVGTASATGWINTSAVLTDVADGLEIASAGATFHRADGFEANVTSGTPYYVQLVCKLGTSATSRLFCIQNASPFVSSNLIGYPTGVLSKNEAGGPISSIAVEDHIDGHSLVSFVWTPNFSGSARIGYGPNSATAGHTVRAKAMQVTTTPHSSLILSNTANTTRAAETASSPMVNGGGPFTVLYDCYFGAVPTSGFPRVFDINRDAAGVGDRSYLLLAGGTNNLFHERFVGGVKQGPSGLVGSLSGPGRYRFAAFVSAGEFRLSTNGGSVAAQTSIPGALPAFDRLHYFSSPLGGDKWPGDCGVSQCIVIPGELSDADMQSWSSLP